MKAFLLIVIGGLGAVLAKKTFGSGELGVYGLHALVANCEYWISTSSPVYDFTILIYWVGFEFRKS